MCLVLKMLQLQPEKEIVIEFIKNEDFKYVRILGAFYLRLVGKPVDIYKVCCSAWVGLLSLRPTLAEPQSAFTKPTNQPNKQTDKQASKQRVCNTQSTKHWHATIHRALLPHYAYTTPLCIVVFCKPTTHALISFTRTHPSPSTSSCCTTTSGKFGIAPPRDGR